MHTAIMRASGKQARQQGEPRPSALLEIDELNVEFKTRVGTIHAVNNLSLRVEQGNVLGIVGETGSGKSVTVRSVIGLIRPPGMVTGGRILLDGTDLLSVGRRRMREIRGADISLITQNPFGALNPVLKLEKQFANILQAHESVSRGDARSRALHALESVQVADPERVLSGYAHELSGGMAQRAVIAMALIMRPKLLIADEPTTALDLITQRQVLDLMLDLVRSTSSTMIIVSHDLGVVAHYCDAIAVMYAGQVVESGPVRTVLAHPAHHYTRALIASVPRRGTVSQGIPGSVPLLAAPPVACTFAARCEAATEMCTSVPPPLEPSSAGHVVACHHPIEHR